MVTSKPVEFAPVETMDLSAGHFALDFVNTASGRAEGPLRERLRTYADLVTWAERVGIVDAIGGQRLRRAGGDGRKAAAVLERARALREAIYRMLTLPKVAPSDMDRLSDEGGRGAARRRVVEGTDGFQYAWPDSTDLDRVLWPVAVAAVELLTSTDRALVRECASHDCSWLFLDKSRNHSRRWCDMKVCGNRAKARRFSERHRP
jgi:predicted RNA-binding Zn ribbon-like protein